MQQAITSLLAFAQTQEEVAARVLEPAAAIVGARAIAIANPDGELIASWNVPAETVWEDARLVEVAVEGGGTIVVWTSPYAPFFGEEELRLLQTLGALVGLALDRVRLYEAEHEARIALERADEVKTNFIALAAHELRTPVTTIHGFVTTLHHLADRLDDEQRQAVGTALVQQTQRLATLVEQLLDLSRLDAEAIEITPEQVDVRSQVEEIVHIAVENPGDVQIDVPEHTLATVDRNALERIVTNLVTNAFRYGVPPVWVRAEQTDRHLRLSVEDSGSGVAPEFIPDLFERFTRSQGAHMIPGGTGLGLAIARAYARAHGGDLVYEAARPHGACFRLILPMGKR
jgi:signal transduction histidine kinase